MKERAASDAEKFTDVLFGASTFDSLSTSEREALFASVPSVTLAHGEYKVVDVLTMNGFVPSKGEANRLIAGKGIKVNGEALEADRTLSETDFRGGLAILQRGKSEKLLVRMK